MSNLLSTGTDLLNDMRPDTLGVEVRLLGNCLIGDWIFASSPPITHSLLTELGLAIGEQERVFFWHRYQTDTSGLAVGPPDLSWKLELKDGTMWRLTNTQNGGPAWKWHGADKSGIMVVTREDYQ